MPVLAVTGHAHGRSERDSGEIGARDRAITSQLARSLLYYTH